MTAYRALTLDEAKHFRLFLLIGISFSIPLPLKKERQNSIALFASFSPHDVDAVWYWKAVETKAGFLCFYSTTFSHFQLIPQSRITLSPAQESKQYFYCSESFMLDEVWGGIGHANSMQLVDKLMDSSSVKLKIPNIRWHIQRAANKSNNLSPYKKGKIKAKLTFEAWRREIV